MPLDLFTVGEPIADTKAPLDVPLPDRWNERKFRARLVNPANRRRLSVIVVGTGLAGGSAAATLAEAGYKVKSFWFQDSPRRAHSVAAQGGINAAKNYRNDGDSVHRLFYDTVKGGDFRSRESNSYRLAEVSVNIIDQAVAQGVPFAREYGGLLDNRSFGGAQVSRTFYARGQTGQQLLYGAYQALERQIGLGNVETHPRTEMLDLIVVDGRARGIVARDLITGQITSHFADAVVLASGGYGNVFYLSTNAKGSNATAIWRAHKRGAYFANPCYTQIHPTCIPVAGEYQSKLTLMSESLRNDGRVWVPKAATTVTRGRSPRTSATTSSSASTRPSATWSPGTSPPGRPRTCATKVAAWARTDSASTWTSPTPCSGWAVRPSRPSTATSSTCTPRSPARTRTRPGCGSTRPCTTRWAGSGSTTTSSPTSPGCS
jgi:succinate dehydrogenase / fumarate reductase, flavoprotein subunit